MIFKSQLRDLRAVRVHNITGGTIKNEPVLFS